MHTGRDLTINFEQAYLGIRLKERRLLDDEMVRHLPNPPNNQQSKEWNIRARSAKRFTSHLSSLPCISNILEIGCGNGWFTHTISKHTNANVFGADINQVELEQAVRLFENHKTTFHLFNILDSNWEYPKPDIIIFNASIQYFPNLSEVVAKCFEILNSGGQIHILDSPLYKAKNVLDARQRSLRYFEQMACPQMGLFYFHHTFEEILKFQPRFLYRPAKFPFNKFITDSPFYWLTISGSNG